MLSKKIEGTNEGSVQLDPRLISINSLSDSSEELGAEGVEEGRPPEIQNLHNELMDPYNDMMQSSCQAAIASYIKSLPQADFESKHDPVKIQRLQDHVVDTLQKHLYRDNRIAVIEECRKPCNCCYIVPPYLSQKVRQVDQIGEDVLINPALVQGCIHCPPPIINKNIQDITALAANQPGQKTGISVYDAHHSTDLPGKFVASNASQTNKKIDAIAKKVLKSAQDVHQFWLKNFNLNSFDGQGAEIKSTVHYGHDFPNAFWNGEQIVFGDGNKYFQNLTNLAVIGHEFGHAITGNKLNYEGESGALNEHLSDVWGALVDQFQKKQTVNQASWLIGEDCIRVGNKHYPLRSMKNPGTAYDSPFLGKDPQPNHYSKRYKGKEDFGGVHINSGIPNKAFYLFAHAQGGYAWEKAGRLWYMAVQTKGLLHPNCKMHEFAQATIHTALKHFPKDFKMHQDLVNAWKSVGVV